MKIAVRLGLLFAIVHLALFLMAWVKLKGASEGEAYSILIFWDIVDFPITLLGIPFTLAHGLLFSGSAPNSDLAAILLYPPNLTHGVAGTIWWYWLPRLLLPRDLGGSLWSKNKSQ